MNFSSIINVELRLMKLRNDNARDVIEMGIQVCTYLHKNHPNIPI